MNDLEQLSLLKLSPNFMDFELNHRFPPMKDAL
jgi:hypothetical protein